MGPKQNSKNLKNIKTLVVHGTQKHLSSRIELICDSNLYLDPKIYEDTQMQISCRRCLKILEKRKLKEIKPEKVEKVEPQRRINYKFIRDFTPLCLLHDKTVPKTDRSKFHTWCMNNDIGLDLRMNMDKRLISKLDSIECFLNWMVRKKYVKIEEIPVTIQLTFTSARQFSNLLMKAQIGRFDSPYPLDLYRHPGSPFLYKQGRMEYPFEPELEDIDIVKQLQSYRHLFEK